MVALHIEDGETLELARKLAERHQTTVDIIVRDTLRERVEREAEHVPKRGEPDFVEAWLQRTAGPSHLEIDSRHSIQRILDLAQRLNLPAEEAISMAVSELTDRRAADKADHLSRVDVCLQEISTSERTPSQKEMDNLMYDDDGLPQ